MVTKRKTNQHRESFYLMKRFPWELILKVVLKGLELAVALVKVISNFVDIDKMFMD